MLFCHQRWCLEEFHQSLPIAGLEAASSLIALLVDQLCWIPTKLRRGVTFEFSSSEAADNDLFLERAGKSSFSQLSKHLIRRVLTKIPRERPHMSNIAMDEFFKGKDVFSFHMKASHRLDAGKVGPSPDARWSQRQSSWNWHPTAGV